MDQPISLTILRFILVITRGYKKCYNASQIIYRGYISTTKEGLFIHE